MSRWTTRLGEKGRRGEDGDGVGNEGALGIAWCGGWRQGRMAMLVMEEGSSMSRETAGYMKAFKL